MRSEADAIMAIRLLSCRAGPEATQPMSPQAARVRLLPQLESPASKALHAIVDAVRQQRSAYLRLRVVVVRFPTNILLTPAAESLLACN